MSKRCRGGYKIGVSDIVLNLENEFRQQTVSFQARDSDIFYIPNPPAGTDPEWAVRVADVDKTVVAWDGENNTIELDDTALVREGERLIYTRAGVPVGAVDVLTKTATLLTVRLLPDSSDPDAADVLIIPVDSLFAENSIETIETKEIKTIKAVTTVAPTRVNLVTMFEAADGHKKKR